MPRVVVADDQGLYRRGLRLTLESEIPDLEVFEAASLEAAVALFGDASPIDVALIERRLLGPMSFDRLRGVRERHPALRLAILSASGSRADVILAFAAGLTGFIFKSQSDEDVVSAVGQLLAGNNYVPDFLLAPRRPARIDTVDAADAPAPVSFRSLTPRQRDVLRLIAVGLSNKEIARELNIAEATARIHTAALLRTLHIRNRTQAAMLARSQWAEFDSQRAPLAALGR